MLGHLGEREAAERQHKAIYRVYAGARHLTGDVGGRASTTEFTEAVTGSLE